MPRERPKGAGAAAVRYDGDQKLLAFAGAITFVLATLFWALLALRLGTESSPLSPAAAALAVASGALFLPAWGLRSKMERGLALTRFEVRGMLLAGLVLGVAVGGVPYLTLRFKLEDPEFLHVASQPENLPPAAR